MLRLIPLVFLMALVAPQHVLSSDKGPPRCGAFFDQWDAPGGSRGIIAMIGFGREVMAAQDCLMQNNVKLACAHWTKLIPVIERTGPPLDEQRVAIDALIKKNSCQ